MMICRRKNCDRAVTNRKLRLCNRHYQQYRRRNGDVRQCSVNGCSQEAWSKGWCKKHHHHWRQTGDPLVAPESKAGQPHPKMRCRIPGCPYEVSAIQGRGICAVHSSRINQGLDVLMPVTPGKPGRKPYVPGIPDEMRAAASRSAKAYLRGECPTPRDRQLHTEYSRRVRAWRLQQRPAKKQLALLEDRP